MSNPYEITYMNNHFEFIFFELSAIKKLHRLQTQFNFEVSNNTLMFNVFIPSVETDLHHQNTFFFLILKNNFRVLFSSIT